MRRARSSAAPRVAATIVIGWCGGNARRKAAAASSRTPAAGDSMIRNGRETPIDPTLPRTLCRESGTTAPRRRASALYHWSVVGGRGLLVGGRWALVGGRWSVVGGYYVAPVSPPVCMADLPCRGCFASPGLRDH